MPALPTKANPPSASRSGKELRFPSAGAPPVTGSPVGAWTSASAVGVGSGVAVGVGSGVAVGVGSGVAVGVGSGVAVGVTVGVVVGVTVGVAVGVADGVGVGASGSWKKACVDESPMLT